MQDIYNQIQDEIQEFRDILESYAAYDDVVDLAWDTTFHLDNLEDILDQLGRLL